MRESRYDPAREQGAECHCICTRSVTFSKRWQQWQLSIPVLTALEAHQSCRAFLYFCPLHFNVQPRGESVPEAAGVFAAGGIFLGACLQHSLSQAGEVVLVNDSPHASWWQDILIAENDGGCFHLAVVPGNCWLKAILKLSEHPHTKNSCKNLPVVKTMLACAEYLQCKGVPQTASLDQLLTFRTDPKWGIPSKKIKSNWVLKSSLTKQKVSDTQRRSAQASIKESLSFHRTVTFNKALNLLVTWLPHLYDDYLPGVLPKHSHWQV